MIPISLVLLVFVILWMRYRYQRDPDQLELPDVSSPRNKDYRAWYPLFVMAAVMAAAWIGFFALTPASLIQVVMLAGMVTALVLAPYGIRKSAFSSGAKHGGVVIFDLCGAGALGEQS